MSTKHTPGPWRFEPATESDFAYVVLDGDAIAIQSENSDEDARLIAAAPEMLAALEDAAQVINAMSSGSLPHCFKPTLEMVNAINYAVAKAKGLTSEDRHA